MNSIFQNISPVLPSSDLERDIQWYDKHLGFKFYMGQEGYAVLNRDDQWIHLQWHANSIEDPLNGGSVIKIFVKDIQTILDEMIDRGTVSHDKMHWNTPWGTHEFGFFDLNKNAIYFVQDAD